MPNAAPRLVRFLAPAIGALLLPSMLTTPALAVPLDAPMPTAALPQAKSIKVSKSREKKIRAALKAYGVSAKTRDKLIKKLKAGKSWDSLKKSKIKKTKSYTKGRYRVKVYTFSDGSVRASRMQQPSERIDMKSANPTGGSVADCQVSQTHYSFIASGCIASDDIILMKAQMTIDYRGFGTDDATIDRAYNAFVFSILLGSASWNEPYKVNDHQYDMVFWIDNGLATAPQILRAKAAGSTTVEAVSTTR